MNIHAERVTIRLRGASPDAVKAALAGLGGAVLQRIAQGPPLKAGPGSGPRVAARPRTVQQPAASGAARLRAAMAGAIADGIRSAAETTRNQDGHE